ncbi:restriction/modification DNA-methylase [Lactococcus phage proPhi5]|nr:restriction/modification DNA-methylase [Lactococcus phage proPhi1]QGJ84641.1 restriction/modification DNA-methylase [Lactococcus phage proPhi5]
MSYFGSLAQLVANRSVDGSSPARTIKKRRVKKRGGNLANSFIIAF